MVAKREELTMSTQLMSMDEAVAPSTGASLRQKAQHQTGMSEAPNSAPCFFTWRAAAPRTPGVFFSPQRAVFAVRSYGRKRSE